MNASEKQEMRTRLENSRQTLVDALFGVSAEDARRAPIPSCWTILEIVEHVAISEDHLFELVGQAGPVETPVVNEKREAAIPVRGLDRSRRIECPPVGLPTGRFPTLAAALDHFLASRASTLHFVEKNTSDLRAHHHASGDGSGKLL